MGRGLSTYFNYHDYNYDVRCQTIEFVILVIREPFDPSFAFKLFRIWLLSERNL